MNESVWKWDSTPSYTDFLLGILDTCDLISKDPAGLGTFESNWTMVKKNGIGRQGVSLVLALAIGMTYARKIFTWNIFKPLGERYQLTDSCRSKLPECMWRFIFHTLFFAWELDLVVFKYRFLQMPQLVFLNQDQKTVVPWDHQLLYVTQMSYYLHGIYSVFFLDVWRKDSLLIISHHAQTILLLFFSYTIKCTEIGLLILLLHDCSDTFLMLGKTSKCLKIQNGIQISFFHNMTKACLLLFTTSWFVCRLYLYPLKAIHTMSSNALPLKLYRLNFSYTCYFLSLFQLAMNIYWSLMLIQLIVKWGTGQMALEDIRDYDVETDVNLKPRTKKVN